jgi:hypothetical protein
VTYSDVWGGYPGAGNMNADPEFVDAAGGNCRLGVFSPCVDAGNNAAVPPGVTTDLDGNPRFVDEPRVPDSGAGTPPIVDMGAYERQLEPVTITVPGDFAVIQDAIEWCLDGDEVVVGPGTYLGWVNPRGKAITVRSTDPTDPAVVESTVLDADGANHVVVCHSGEGPDTVLSGFTIQHGYADSAPPYGECGGGMVNWGSSPTVTYCVFVANYAKHGSGMYNGNGSNPNVIDCIFTGNRGTLAPGAYGAGMCNSNSSPTVSHCTFRENDFTSYSGRGGGMANLDNSSPVVQNCTFELNGGDLVKGGGGMFNDGSSPTVTDCTFRENKANQGGGMANFSNSSAVVENCTFEGNGTGRIAGNDGGPGGGMANQDSSPTVINCTFDGNWTRRGGEGGMGYYADDGGPGGGMWNNGSSSPVVTGCFFVDNYTGDGGKEHFAGTGGHGGDGAAMYNGPGTMPEVTNCWFSSNYTGDGGDSDGGDGGDAGDGAGMFNAGDFVITGCNFMSNHTGAGGDSDLADDGRAGIGAGMFNYYCPGLAYVQNCGFVGNSTTVRGGGMCNWYSDIYVGGCTFSDNTAGTHGAGMWNNGGWHWVDRCLFNHNTATYAGGGMRNDEGSDTWVTNCTFLANTANQGGGVANASTETSVINCTFDENSAASGGGVYGNNSSHADVANSIFWGNAGGSIYGPATVTYSDVEGGHVGEGNIDADPLFDSYLYSSSLLPGSPCIDAGSNASVPPAVTTDLDGNPRFVDDGCTEDTGLGDPPIVDMGASEFQGDSWDVDGDGMVGVTDFLALLAAWGPCPDPCPPLCPGDFDGDCDVGVADFLILLAKWGPCS